MERFSGLIIPLACLFLLLLSVRIRVSANVMCSGRLWCAVQVPSNPVVVRTSFQYVPGSGLCVQLEQDKVGCVPAANCSFSSADECYSVCGEGRKNMEGCEGTEYGCCGDGVTVREGERGCPEGSEAATTGGKGERSGVHWGLITSGVSGAVLLLGLVAVVGLATYAYRQRQRNRHRWYIHEVLQMNDGGESSDSGAATDSSWDDPEHKNLFDRL